MAREVIAKSGQYRGVSPNMADYETERASFTWDEARRSLDGLPAGRGLNIAHEAVVRHARGPRANHVALRCLSRHGDHEDVTYAELDERSSRIAGRSAAIDPDAAETVA